MAWLAVYLAQLPDDVTRKEQPLCVKMLSQCLIFQTNNAAQLLG